ncbi:tectonic-1-like [Tubulanus polymorphus]|uniref:tectonic-1-like n=1 Tax=Tubulanus polymorphus TaxID=672921 RepID=UPI003DA2B7C8
MADGKIFFASVLLLLLRVTLLVYGQTSSTPSASPTTATQSTANPTSAPTTNAPTTPPPAPPTTTIIVPISPTTTNVPNNTDLGPCTCDLTPGVCDVNCCCDPACTSNDLNAFTRCDESVNLQSTQYCIQQSKVFRSNTPHTVDVSNPSLFCIVTDNFQTRNYYYVPNVANTRDLFLGYKSTAGPLYSYENVALTTNPTTQSRYDSYKSGEPIYTLFNQTNILGKLGLPRPAISSECDDTNPAAFMMDQSFTCIRKLAPLAQSCQTSYALDAATFYSGFRVIPIPSVLAPKLYNASNPETWVTTPLYDQQMPIDPVLPAKCVGAQGIVENCRIVDSVPTPQYDTATKTCRYAVKEVEYIISQNGTKGIVSVNVQFTLGDITDSNLPLSQTYKATYIRPQQAGASPAFKYSGNPGYRVGEPVMAGKLVNQQDSTGTLKQAISINTDRNQWMTVIRPGPGGSCLTQIGKRESVKFGVNIRSGCLFELSLANITNVCKVLQTSVSNALLGDAPTYVATFGNSLVENVGDWVPIIKDNLPSGASVSLSGGCYNLVLGLHIEIIYANVGALGNPQPKILGVKYTWDKQQNLQFKCIGQYCQPGTEQSQTQKFELVTSVTFVDASVPAVSLQAEIPLFTVRLPYDFFYPFFAGAGANLIPRTGVVLLAAVLATLKLTS